MIKKKYVKGLRLLNEGDAGNGLNRGNTYVGMCDKENVDFRTPHIEKGIGKESGSVTGGGGFDTPEYHFGEETQAIVIATVDKVTSAERTGKAVANDDIPSCSLNLTQNFQDIRSAYKAQGSGNNTHVVAAVPVSFCPPSVSNNAEAPQRGKREQQTSESMRSPFVVRAVDISACNVEE